VEVQALAAKAPYGAPQRVSTGFDHKRLALLLAVLEKRAGLPFGQLDVFLNVVGGLRIVETAGDAGVAAALASSVFDRAVPADAVIIGEIGLGGRAPRGRAGGPASRRGRPDGLPTGIHLTEGVAGDPQNIKITVPSDLEIAELMARRLRRHD
jgi:hypothetical protein